MSQNKEPGGAPTPSNPDGAYWEEYYRSGAAPQEPSLFAQYVRANYAKPGQSLVELGCGNGRDARFFAASGLAVVAVDQCAGEIEELIKTNGRHENLRYAAGDFTDMPDGNPFDLVYSRFTLHSVTAEGQASTLGWSARNLAPGGRLCIETRGKKNEIFGNGEPVPGQPDAFVYEGHYRRFVGLGDFTEQVRSYGLTILNATEATGFAPFRDTDYHFIRVIAERPEDNQMPV